VYEAPGRVAATLRDLAAACGDERPGAVSRELTKVHETIVRGSLGELAAAAADGTIPPRGEFTVVVGSWSGARPPGAQAVTADDAISSARDEVERLVGDGVARGEAARRVAAATGLPRRSLYGADRSR
jgi:16S rRNA (cytidine1402-2'-O)-methyltransferase